ncbi:MAG: S-layer homology domain-containing protein, partial [Clostridia bacterium]|nr:S-layer homology domain-containing protein [Clostridia bacterium]
MKKIITVISVCLAIAMIIPLAVCAAESGGLPFRDVPRTSWFCDAVRSVYDAGAMKGIASDVFGPDEPMTRAQFVTIIARISGDEYVGLSGEATFRDTEKNEYYSDALGWAVKNGLINGYPDNSFKPDAPILRQEFAAVFARFLSHGKIEITSDDAAPAFRDSSSFPGYAKESIETLRKTGLVKGDSAGNYNPEDNMTRAEIAQVIARFLEKTAEKRSLEDKVTDFLDRYLCSEHGKLDLFFNYTDTSLTEDNMAALLRDLIGLDESVAVEFDDFGALVDGYSGGSDGGGDPSAGWSSIDGVKVTFTDPAAKETYTVQIDFSLRKVIPAGELDGYKNGAL